MIKVEVDLADGGRKIYNLEEPKTKHQKLFYNQVMKAELEKDTDKKAELLMEMIDIHDRMISELCLEVKADAEILENIPASHKRKMITAIEKEIRLGIEEAKK